MNTYLPFELFENKSSNFRIEGKGWLEIKHDEIILDPSVLFYMTHNEILENDTQYYLPDNIIKLIKLARENNEYTIFLKSFLKYFGEDHSENLESNSWSLFYKNYEKLKIKPITDNDVDANTEGGYYNFYLNEFTDHDFYFSMSPRKNFFGEAIGKILEFSRKTGKVIVSKTRKFADTLREKITCLELPKKLDSMAEAKQKTTGKLFNFKGGKATKAFIGISLSVAGVIVANPALNATGLVFAFTDP